MPSHHALHFSHQALISRPSLFTLYPPPTQASGGDDGALRVWDLRAFAAGSAVANFEYHRGPVTAVEWCPFESSMLATTSADNQLAVWDLALERDPGGWG